MKFHGTNGTRMREASKVVARDESRALQDASTAPNTGFGVVSRGRMMVTSGDSQPEKSVKVISPPESMNERLSMDGWTSSRWQRVATCGNVWQHMVATRRHIIIFFH